LFQKKAESGDIPVFPRIIVISAKIRLLNFSARKRLLPRLAQASPAISS
jgi:hypothetical protein